MADKKQFLDLNGLSYFLRKVDAKKANLESPALTGTPTAPTATDGTATTQIATTEFVKNAIARKKQQIDTSANWAKKTTFIPLAGEIIVYSDLKKIKVGDGSTTVTNLDFINDYVFNTAYNASTNKAATMDDITIAIGNITPDDIGAVEVESLELASIATTGNVNDLIQDDDDYIIFNCGNSIVAI